MFLSQELLHPISENKKFVDHIDNCKTNNNIENLRWATCSENGQNKNMRKNNTSGMKGALWPQKRKNGRHK